MNEEKWREHIESDSMDDDAEWEWVASSVDDDDSINDAESTDEDEPESPGSSETPE